MNQSPIPTVDLFELSLPAIVLVNTPADVHNFDRLTPCSPPPARAVAYQIRTNLKRAGVRGATS